jgi:hypothetical protein
MWELVDMLHKRRDFFWEYTKMNARTYSYRDRQGNLTDSKLMQS